MNINDSEGTTVTSVTYGGQALTLLAAQTGDTGGITEVRTEVWYQSNPTTGTNHE